MLCVACCVLRLYLSCCCRLYAAINARDVAALASCLAADVTYQNLALLDSFTGATVSECVGTYTGCCDSPYTTQQVCTDAVNANGMPWCLLRTYTKGFAVTTAAAEQLHAEMNR